jgi:PAS domain S-box-containing protein
MRFALDAAEVGVWERALDGRIVYWSDEVYRLRGLQPDDPRTPDQIATATSHPDDHEALLVAVGRAVREGTPYRFEFRVRRPDGGWRWLLTQGSVLRDPQGQPIGMAGINYDITERKEAEALRLEKARAEQASREKSAFLARLSHELRTPMNAVLGFAQLLESDLAEPPSARQQGRLRRIAEAGARMMALVDDLLDLASTETTEATASTEPLPLAQAVQEARDLLTADAARLGVGLVTRSLQATPPLRVDHRRLVQALVQVGQHVLRRQRAGRSIEFTLAAGPGTVTVSVRDDGPAYGDDERATLFDAFARPSAAAEGGTGLGLALARRLVESIGGTLEMRLGAEGTQAFVVELPADTPPAAAGSAARPMTVLCVEDNPVNLLLVRELLSMRPQLKLHEAVDGTSGIAAALAHRPDLLLLDLQLPDINGVDVLARLRSEPALAHSTFIALSANAMPEQVAAARAAGFHEYWTKPIDFSQFLSGLDRISQGASRSRTHAPSAAR